MKINQKAGSVRATSSDARKLAATRTRPATFSATRENPFARKHFARPQVAALSSPYRSFAVLRLLSAKNIIAGRIDPGAQEPQNRESTARHELRAPSPLLVDAAQRHGILRRI